MHLDDLPSIHDAIDDLCNPYPWVGKKFKVAHSGSYKSDNRYVCMPPDADNKVPIAQVEPCWEFIDDGGASLDMVQRFFDKGEWVIV